MSHERRGIYRDMTKPTIVLRDPNQPELRRVCVSVSLNCPMPI